MLGNEHELKTLWSTRQIALRLFGGMRGVVVEDQAQDLSQGIGRVQLVQKFDEVPAPA